MRLLTSAIALGFLGMAAVPAAATEITASVWFPNTHPLTRDGYLALAETLKEKSGGDLTMQVYTGDAVLPPAAHLSGLRDGIVDMTYHAGTYTPSDLPADNVLAALGIGLRDSMTVAGAVADFYINDPMMQEMFASQGIVFLGSYASPSYIMMCRTPVVSLADIAGKKLRMPSPVHAAWAASVDAAAVNVPSSEMFSGLEKGQLDCAINAANDLKSRSLWDVAKNVTLLDLGPYFAGWEYAMNKPAWDGLGENERRLLVDTIADNIVDMTAAYLASVDDALAEADAHGVTVSEPAEDLQASLDTFVAEKVEPMALDVGSRFNLEGSDGLLQRFNDTYAKWQGLMADVDEGDLDAVKALFHKEIYDKLDVATYGAN
ncbi:C4-dicarboxylate ABC transporter [Acuticoccus sediminis]|uniref:C4-dicarboxylate ABC transporter n=1 Tax=Acuticoccus sediminis TaxID=2184697 RepID=A0A8B2NUN4_9HYPH|nr:C4-dicarboxylate TRAP transporter substrate-binding protein [Acuticoccus sediminis]RAI02209.1 C4-dicarboxylate ABC transporter [Acuticoccus sediminis]